MTFAAIDHDTSAANRALVSAFVERLLIQKQVRVAFDAYVHAGYIQHNLIAGDGRAAAIAMLEGFFASTPDIRFDILRVLVDGDFAAVHAHMTMDASDSGTAVVDIFRIADGKIIEHWDVVQPPSGTAVNASDKA